MDRSTYKPHFVCFDLWVLITIPQAIWPYSGHYHPTEENFMEFISFLEEHHVDLSNVKVIFLNHHHICGLTFFYVHFVPLPIQLYI